MTGPRPRPEVLEVLPYVGGESRVDGVNRVIKLSSNEGAFAPPPGVRAAVARAVDELHRYPDGEARALRAAIGARFGLDPARIICGNGSDDIIAQLCVAYGGPGREVLMTEHGFSIYQIAGTYAGSRVIKAPERNLTADVDALLARVSPATRLLFLANPNNPTGSLLPQSEVERLRAALPEEVLLVLDSAYAEYVDRPGYDPGVSLVDAAGNTVMTRTFSKIFGLGGMRIGWAYAPPAVIDVLNRVRAPFNVSIPAQAAAIAALAEISSASVAAATICAKRYTFPAPAQPIDCSHAWAYGKVVPPPTVPTSKPGSRNATCKPPSTRRPVPCAIELVPTMPRSCPVAAKIAAIAEAGVKATDCMPDATAPCVPANDSSSKSSIVVRSTRRTASSVSVVSTSTVFPWPPRSK